MKIQQLFSKDKHLFAKAVKLLNRTQGQDLFPANYLDERTADENSYVIAALEGSEVLAIGVAQVIKDLDYYLAFDAEIKSNLENKIVGSFSTLCVTEDMQGMGIGQMLSQLRLDWLKSKSCNVVVGISWVSGLENTSDRVFEKMGFRPVKRVENFFYESSLEKPFYCPGCGAPPLHLCGHHVYERESLELASRWPVRKQTFTTHTKPMLDKLFGTKIESRA